MNSFKNTFILLTFLSSLASATGEHPTDVKFPLQCQTASGDAFTILNTHSYSRGDTTYGNACMYYTHEYKQNFFCMTRSPVSGNMNVDFDQYTTFEHEGVRYRSYPFTYFTVWIDYGSCVAVEK